jgi:hypothetical protein
MTQDEIEELCKFVETAMKHDQVFAWTERTGMHVSNVTKLISIIRSQIDQINTLSANQKQTGKGKEKNK